MKALPMCPINPQIVDNLLTRPHMKYYNEYKIVSQKLMDLSQYSICEYTQQYIGKFVRDI